MRRREFIQALVGTAATLPLAAQAQRPERARRLAILMPENESDEESQRRKRALERSLTSLGWTIGRSLQIDYRWAGGDFEHARSAALELIASRPDAIMAVATPSAHAVRQVNDSVPVVFVGLAEPVAQGFVASLSHPGGNFTGFSNMEVTFGEKWLELLNEMAPHLKRVAVMFNPDTTGNSKGFVQVMEALAQRLSIALTTVPVRQIADFDLAIVALGREADCGIVLLPDAFTLTHHKLIVEAANRQHIPTIGAFKVIAADGALASYGVDIVEQFRLAAGYVDRILKGEKAADLPVQQPVKFEFVINLKTAKTLGVEIPPQLLARADEVIE
jgi:putative tryptophan/tyrosine transport system substrate-binding protein